MTVDNETAISGSTWYSRLLAGPLGPAIGLRKNELPLRSFDAGGTKPLNWSGLQTASDSTVSVPEAPASALSAARLPSLDAVRGIAILIVVVHHVTQACWPSASAHSSAIRKLLYTGWIGVDLFFVLSGFLITGILLDTKNSPRYFRSFYARRVLRIFPLYYVVLSLILLAADNSWRIGQLVPKPELWKWYYLYLNNWLGPDLAPNIIGHFWTLAIEEQFYVLWPLAVCLLPRRFIAYACLGGIALSVGVSEFITVSHSSLDLLRNTVTRGFPTLLTGAVLACVVRDHPLGSKARKWIYAAGAFCLVTFVLGEYLPKQPQIWELTWPLRLAIGFGAIVLFAFVKDQQMRKTGGLLGSTILRNCGKYSYGIYVYHVPILGVGLLILPHFFRDIGRSTVASALYDCGVMLVTYAVAFLSFHLFEKRLLSFKRYFTA